MKRMAGVLIAASLLGAMALLRDRPAPAAGPSAAQPARDVACTLEAAPLALPAALRETSGIARAADGSLWTHNDGAGGRIHRIDDAAALLQTVELDDVVVTDVEDIDAGPCPGGAGECLWLADIGDNDAERREVALLAVPLPDRAATRARATLVPFVYPGGPRDAEALAIIGERAFVVSKGRNAPIEVFEVDLAGSEGARTARPLRTIAERPSSSRDRVTGGAASEDGAWIALRTNDALAVYRTDALAGGGAPALTFDLRPLGESQGEGIDLAADGTVWLTSEAERAGSPTLARLRCSLPE